MGRVALPCSGIVTYLFAEHLRLQLECGVEVCYKRGSIEASCKGCIFSARLLYAAIHYSMCQLKSFGQDDTCHTLACS